MFDKLKYISFFSFLAVGVFASEVIDQEFTTITSSVLLEEQTISGGEYANLDTVFERVITLGQDCVSKGHINAFFNPEQTDARLTKKGHADLFDWMQIQDYNLFAKAIESKLSDFFDRDDLEIKPAYVVTLYNNKYKMRWWHLFDGAYIKNSFKDISVLTEEKLNDLFPLIKRKIDYLKNKFLEAKYKKTLYVISTPNVGFDLKTILDLRDSIEKSRDNDKNFFILFVPQIKTFESTENILVRTSDQYLQLWHQGSDQLRWNEILSEFKFISDIWN